MSFKRLYHPILFLGQLFLPFLISYLSQRLAIGRGYEFSFKNFDVIFINYIAWGLILLFFSALFKKQYLPIVLYLLFFILFSIANRYKIKFLNQPVKILDLSVGRDITGFVPLVIKHTNLKKELITSLLLLIFSIFILKKFFTLQFKQTTLRLFFGIFSTIILLMPYLNTNLYNQILTSSNLKFNAWDRAENCRNNGILLCFLNDFAYLKHIPPSNYNQDSIKNIAKNIPPSTLTSTSSIQPNVILILSESLWDPTQLPQISLSSDPIKNIRKDLKGNFISPVFGGETANVEFEILTGLNNYFFADDNYPYTESITKPMPSLFTVFKNQQYLTTAIHPYSSWFYNRDNVYKYFDLDKFTNLSNMSSYQNAGPFVSEKSFFEEILKQFNSTENPQFILGISIQNHAPYEPNRFSNKQITINSKLDSFDKETLQSYIEGINLTDQAYSNFKKELVKSSKPTIVILFGDHLPFLGPNYDIYKKLGFDINDPYKLHTTPLAIWSNYQNQFKNIGSISPAFLSNQVLDLANIPPQYQFSFTNQFRRNTTILTKSIRPTNINSFEKDVNSYRLLQYDLIYGKQYFLNQN